MGRTYPSCSLALSLLFFLLSPTVHAASVNKTIDDRSPHPGITYSEGWMEGVATGPGVDISQIRNGTLHKAVQRPGDTAFKSLTAKFTGTAVYVYNVLQALPGAQPPNPAPPLNPAGPLDGLPAISLDPSSIIGDLLGGARSAVTYLTFELDGAQVGTFSRALGAIAYNVPVYVNTSLAQGEHTLVMRVQSGQNGNETSIAYFDYITYTTTDDAAAPPATSSPATNSTTVVNGTTVVSPATGNGTTPSSTGSQGTTTLTSQSGASGPVNGVAVTSTSETTVTNSPSTVPQAPSSATGLAQRCLGLASVVAIAAAALVEAV